MLRLCLPPECLACKGKLLVASSLLVFNSMNFTQSLSKHSIHRDTV